MSLRFTTGLNGLFAVMGLVLLSGCAAPSSSQADLQQISFGDPFILLDDSTYYMYGTASPDTGIKVYRSADLKHWEGPVGARSGFALHTRDVYGEGGYWAPEVYHRNGRYYMFFSVEEHIAVATSDHPAGPFTQEEASVLRPHKSIDSHLFVDDDGSAYLYFANFKDGLEIWGARLDDDLMSVDTTTLTRLLTQSQPWERSPKEPVGIVNEGPYVIKRDGQYYMTYSANHFASQDYGIGLARASSPLGNWRKSEQNPVLQNPDSLVGTGHSAFFKDKEGQLHIVYHAHYDTSSVHPRQVYINPVRFGEAPDGSATGTLELLGPGTVPVRAEK